VMSLSSVRPFSSAASGRFGTDDNTSGEMSAGVRVKHQGPVGPRLQLVADLNKIAIRILEVNREDRPSRAGPLGRSVDDLNAFAPKVRDNGINWRRRQNAEVTASGHSITRNTRRGARVLQAYLVRTKVQRPLARSLFTRRHAQHTFIKLARRRYISDTENDMIESAHLHDRNTTAPHLSKLVFGFFRRQSSH